MLTQDHKWVKKLTEKNMRFRNQTLVSPNTTPIQYAIYGFLTHGQNRTNKVPCVYYAKDLRGLVNSFMSALMNFIDLPL